MMGGGRGGRGAPGGAPLGWAGAAPWPSATTAENPRMILQRKPEHQPRPTRC